MERKDRQRQRSVKENGFSHVGRCPPPSLALTDEGGRGWMEVSVLINAITVSVSEATAEWDAIRCFAATEEKIGV